MTARPGIEEPAPFDNEAEWRVAHLIYPLYRALARECIIDVFPCAQLENEIDPRAEGSLAPVRDWFVKMDELVQVHQLRHFLQTTTLAGDEALQGLILHHLRKQERNESDRNKIDFLLVQYFSLCVSPRLRDSEIDLSHVAQILEPVLGQFDAEASEWLAPLDALTAKSGSCRTLKELFTSRIIEQGRKLKDAAGDKYFLPAAMAAFTRFGFLLRRSFFRLMHQDLNAILDGLRELEARGVEGLDCRRAQFSAFEPMARLRMICQSWKVMFHAEYSAGQPLCLLVDLRTVVEAALAKSQSKANLGVPAVKMKSFAAAAGAAGRSGATPLPDFEVKDFAPHGETGSSSGAFGAANNKDSDFD
ncbi:MAG: hypothetical protein ACRD2U_14665 [Terriglobales bacterium]